MPTLHSRRPSLALYGLGHAEQRRPRRNSDLARSRRRHRPEGPDFSAPLLPAISLWRSSRRRGAARCPRRAARGSRGAGHRGAAAASDKLWRISLLERPKLRRRPLQQALPRTAAVAEAGSRLLRRVLEMILDLCGFFDLINLAPSSRARRRHGSRPSLRGSVKSPDATIRDAISSMSSDQLDYAGSIEASRTKRSSP